MKNTHRLRLDRLFVKTAGLRLAGALSPVCEALLPCLCLHCGEPVDGDRVGMCAACWSLIHPMAGVCCPRCGGADRVGPERCLQCRSDPPPQQGTVIWGEYEGPLRSALLALKAGRHDELAVGLGRRLAARAALEPWVEAVELVTAVPSHPMRRLSVGWPAAACLARVVSAELHRPSRRVVVRHGRDRQTGRSRSRRIRLPRRAFSGRGTAAGRVILVVDDVTTTGTTLRRTAEALLKAGADAVYCAVMAATPDAGRGT